MNCYDCAHPEPAVAVCHFCGAGVCREHLRVQENEVHDLAGTGPSHAATGRRMTCGVCAGAQRVASAAASDG